MSLFSRSALFLVALLVAWNGDYCQAQGMPPAVGKMVGVLMELGKEASTLNWHPLQPCWVDVAQEVRESCGSKITMSCLDSEVSTGLTSCLQRELVSNGPNLWALASRIGFRHQPEDGDESATESS